MLYDLQLESQLFQSLMTQGVKDFKVFRPARNYILRVRTCISSNLPLETGRKLNERKTFKKRSGRLLNVLYVMRPGN